MRPERPSRALAIGIVLSLVLHLGAGLAFVTREAWAANPDAVESDRPLDRLPPQDQHITLGETTSTAVSMTWIGFDEYREHIVDKAEVEQAALQRDPSGGGRPIPAMPAPNPAAVAEAIARPAIEAADRMLKALEALPMPPPADTGDIAVAEHPEKDEEQADAPDEPEPAEQQVAEAHAPPKRPVESPQEQPPSEGEGDAKGPGAGTTIAEGEQSERESDASSLVEAQVKQLGQPLAARGLHITTTKPRLSYRTQIMGGSADPVVRLFFASDGRVRSVEFLQRSGNIDIDRPVEDALYAWRAEGEALATLGDPIKGETISVDVRIIR